MAAKRRSRMATLLPALVGAALLLCPGAAEAGAGPASGFVQVVIEGEPAVQGEHITLAEIARIEAPSASVASALASLVVGRAALPGESRPLSLGALEMRLRQAGLSPDAVVIVAGDDPVAVRTEAQVLSAAEIRRAVEAWYAGEVALTEGDLLRVQVEAEDQILPVGPWEIRVVTEEPKWGRGIVTLEIAVGGRPYRRVQAEVRAEIEQTVPVAARFLARGEPLGPADVRMERRTLQRPVALPDLAGAGNGRGIRASRPVRAGTILTAELVEPVPDLLAGEPVLLVARRRGIVVTTAGEALEDARVGETAAAKNLESGKTVHGRLAPDGTLVVEDW